MTRESFEKWLAAYGAAWQNGDADAVIVLFSDDAEYYENPFATPMRGKEAIHRYWSEGAQESQKDVVFEFTDAVAAGNTGMARWRASFVRVPSGRHVALDGFLTAEFNAAGKCSVFREWWHRREGDVVQAS